MGAWFLFGIIYIAYILLHAHTPHLFDSTTTTLPRGQKLPAVSPVKASQRRHTPMLPRDQDGSILWKFYKLPEKW